MRERLLLPRLRITNLELSIGQIFKLLHSAKLFFARRLKTDDGERFRFSSGNEMSQSNRYFFLDSVTKKRIGTVIRDRSNEATSPAIREMARP